MKALIHDPLKESVKLPTSNCAHKLESRNVLYFTDDSSGFKVDHIALVFQPTIKKIEHLFLDTTKLTLTSFN